VIVSLFNNFFDRAFITNQTKTCERLFEMFTPLEFSSVESYKLSE
jgi:hypothetical protein